MVYRHVPIYTGLISTILNSMMDGHTYMCETICASYIWSPIWAVVTVPGSAAVRIPSPERTRNETIKQADGTVVLINVFTCEPENQ